ncbi:hypothetical protein OB03_12465, partial [Brevundimonas sp. GN22]
RRLLTLAHTKSNYSRWGTEFSIASDGGAFEVLEERDGGARKAKSERLAPSHKVALKALQKALAEASEASPGGPIPTGVRVVKYDLWRQYAYNAGISPADTPEANKRAFHRAAEALTAKGIVGVHLPFAWVTEAGQ